MPHGNAQVNNAVGPEVLDLSAHYSNLPSGKSAVPMPGNEWCQAIHDLYEQLVRPGMTEGKEPPGTPQDVITPVVSDFA